MAFAMCNGATVRCAGEALAGAKIIRARPIQPDWKGRVQMRRDTCRGSRWNGDHGAV